MQGDADVLLKPHPLDDALRADKASRLVAYCELFRYELDPGLVDEIHRATPEDRGDPVGCRSPNLGWLFGV